MGQKAGGEVVNWHYKSSNATLHFICLGQMTENMGDLLKEAKKIAKNKGLDGLWFLSPGETESHPSLDVMNEENWQLICQKNMPEQYSPYKFSNLQEKTGDMSDEQRLAASRAAMERLAKENLPRTMGIEWTELAYLQIIAGSTTMLVFGGAVVLGFLVLADEKRSAPAA